MSIIKCTNKTIVDAPERTPDNSASRSIRVVKRGASVSTRRDGEGRPTSAKVADVFRESSIDAIRQNLLGSTVLRWRAKRESEQLHLLGVLAK